jgi:hypothetical protein
MVFEFSDGTRMLFGENGLELGPPGHELVDPSTAFDSGGVSTGYGAGWSGYEPMRPDRGSLFARCHHACGFSRSSHRAHHRPLAQAQVTEPERLRKGGGGLR